MEASSNVAQQRSHFLLHANPSTEGENNSVSNSRAEIPLPGDLKRILKEVARTGACSWLSWDNDAKDFQPAESSANIHKAALGSSSSASSLKRQAFSAHRRSTSSTYTSQAPPRKKHRNGVHKASRRRFGGTDSQAKAGGHRKRPLFLIRTHPNTTANATAFSAPSSVGSGRTSGSEPDDSTQYECDSEGTSATTNSEVSVERLRKNQQRMNVNALHASIRPGAITGSGEEVINTQHHRTLQEAFRSAVGLVLDHFFRNRGGYKLSPAEKRRNATLVANSAQIENGKEPSKRLPLSPEDVFLQRRKKLVAMLQPELGSFEDARNNQKGSIATEGPPFTIQRIAEVLVAPERYYTQTHKLCNCLEKLLLVTSSAGAFGGSTGGDTSQSRREEREMAALADERGRQESELRQRRLRRRAVSPFDDASMENNTDTSTRHNGQQVKDELSPKASHIASEGKKEEDDRHNMGVSSPNKEALVNGSQSSREMLEAAARASLRTKFDHVGIDPHSSPDRDVRSIAENRGMTNSPPPPSLSMSAALPGHGGVAGFVRQHLPDQNTEHHSIPRVPSPIVFSPSNEAQIHSSASIHSATNMHMLQLHHAVALAGVSLGRGAPTPLDLMTIDAGGGMTVRPHGSLAATSEGADLEAEHGRSSASNSDVDSESDDISLDDSASDRSDGSDSGSATHYEPFTAARAMALNRMQQQQRLQSRVLTSLNSLHQSEGFRPPADSEYQSGDSIDSMRAEDSGGSDSSSQSSDIAD